MASTNRTFAIIQARLGSTRLPRKVLMNVDSVPLIAHVIERVSRIDGIDGFACAIPEGEEQLEHTLDALDVPYVTGSERDVLGRYAHAAEMFDADVILRITADCPLLDPVVAEAVLALYRSDRNLDYCWNDTTVSGYPDGLDVEVFSRSALKWAARTATEAGDREHVGPWLRRNVKVARLDAPANYSALKLSVDTEDDLERVRAIVNHLPPKAFRLSDTLAAARRAGLLGVAA